MSFHYSLQGSDYFFPSDDPDASVGLNSELSFFKPCDGIGITSGNPELDAAVDKAVRLLFLPSPTDSDSFPTTSDGTVIFPRQYTIEEDPAIKAFEVLLNPKKYASLVERKMGLKKGHPYTIDPLLSRIYTNSVMRGLVQKWDAAEKEAPSSTNQEKVKKLLLVIYQYLSTTPRPAVAADIIFSILFYLQELAHDDIDFTAAAKEVFGDDLSKALDLVHKLDLSDRAHLYHYTRFLDNMLKKGRFPFTLNERTISTLITLLTSYTQIFLNPETPMDNKSDLQPERLLGIFSALFSTPSSARPIESVKINQTTFGRLQDFILFLSRHAIIFRRPSLPFPRRAENHPLRAELLTFSNSLLYAAIHGQQATLVGKSQEDLLPLLALHNKLLELSKLASDDSLSLETILRPLVKSYLILTPLVTRSQLPDTSAIQRYLAFFLHRLADAETAQQLPLVDETLFPMTMNLLCKWVQAPCQGYTPQLLESLSQLSNKSQVVERASMAYTKLMTHILPTLHGTSYLMILYKIMDITCCVNANPKLFNSLLLQLIHTIWRKEDRISALPAPGDPGATPDNIRLTAAITRRFFSILEIIIQRLNTPQGAHQMNWDFFGHMFYRHLKAIIEKYSSVMEVAVFFRKEVLGPLRETLHTKISGTSFERTRGCTLLTHYLWKLDVLNLVRSPMQRTPAQVASQQANLQLATQQVVLVKEMLDLTDSDLDTILRERRTPKQYAWIKHAAYVQKQQERARQHPSSSSSSSGHSTSTVPPRSTTSGPAAPQLSPNRAIPLPSTGRTGAPPQVAHATAMHSRQQPPAPPQVAHSTAMHSAPLPHPPSTERTGAPPPQLNHTSETTQHHYGTHRSISPSPEHEQGQRHAEAVRRMEQLQQQTTSTAISQQQRANPPGPPRAVAVAHTSTALATHLALPKSGSRGGRSTGTSAAATVSTHQPQPKRSHPSSQQKQPRGKRTSSIQ